jgi:hypothetical protein
VKVVDARKEIEHFAFKGQYLKDILIEQINSLDASIK